MYTNELDAREAEVTQDQAMHEILKHGLNTADFFNEVGVKEFYKGSEVLDWLGY